MMMKLDTKVAELVLVAKISSKHLKEQILLMIDHLERWAWRQYVSLAPAMVLIRIEALYS